ncbi:MAG: GNAT family N-acetyltransferase [Solirubrobacteraceae bacterium]
MWRFMAPIVAAGETFSWDQAMPEAEARDIWFAPPPGATLVAVDAERGDVIGTAVMVPNHGGPASHVATASFMVDRAHARRGAGRALGEAVIDRSRHVGFRAIQFNAVVESNTPAVTLWRALGFEVLATIPEAFDHPDHGYVGLHVMHQSLLDEPVRG